MTDGGNFHSTRWCDSSDNCSRFLKPSILPQRICKHLSKEWSNKYETLLLGLQSARGGQHPAPLISNPRNSPLLLSLVKKFKFSLSCLNCTNPVPIGFNGSVLLQRVRLGVLVHVRTPQKGKKSLPNHPHRSCCSSWKNTGCILLTSILLHAHWFF